MASFRIGIDLGTTNCALAYVPCDSTSGHSDVLAIFQPETAHSATSQRTLPSFLYLAPDQNGHWTAGRFARTRAAEVPGRVVHSAKSWLVHHAADRRAKFLPLGSADLTPPDLISPVDALSKLLKTLSIAWNEVHPDAPLESQDVAITVPASFDPAAQQLTLEAAREAGFPGSTFLLEEPQAAFYAWLENDASALDSLAAGNHKSHVLVVDIGGGTTDLSLFAVEPRPDSPLPRLQRIAVSDHVLLGGDNLDLSLAHFLEEKLTPGAQLAPSTFAQLLARCREIKEEALGEKFEGGKVWPVAVSRPGASLLSGTLRCEISASEIFALLLEGFFPLVTAGEHPLRAALGLREMGLPYAKDPAVTRHLSDFLRGRAAVDFILFNGGLTKAPAIRRRILENLTRWQPEHIPKVLENTDPELAVARGAARFLHLRATGDESRIEAGASHSYYMRVGQNSTLCLLPQGAPAEKDFTACHPELRALVGKPASFELLRNARRPSDQPSDVVATDAEGFSDLPAVETILASPQGSRAPSDPIVRVKIRTCMRFTGLLKVELLSAEPGLRWDALWPLEFSLRGCATAPQKRSADTSDAVTRAGEQLAALLDPARKTRQKLTANAVFTVGEKALGNQKSAWTGGIVRRLFDIWLEAAPQRIHSADHEETWLHLAGWFLRPGCGMTGDAERASALAKILAAPPRFPSGAVKIQRWICARRIAAGLDAVQSEAIWKAAAVEWREGATPSAEIVLLAGSLESIGSETRTTVLRSLTKAIEAQPRNPAFWKALGRLLSRVLFHAGTEQILPPEFVEESWEILRETDPGESLRAEVAVAWLRAARLTGLRPVDVSKSTRNQIDSLLRRWDINQVRRRVLHEVVPPAASDQTGLLGEAPPPGLTLQSEVDFR
jgi:molecular chaperone DnaK (HSP70)